VKIKMICGAIVGTVALASGITAIAQDVTAEGHTTEAAVVTVNGSDAEAYLPAYRKMLEQQLKSSDPQQRTSATEALHKLDTYQLKTFQIQTKAFGPLAPGASLLPASPAVIFPPNPTNGETFTITSCSYNQQNNMFFQTVQQWEYFSNTGDWVQTKNDTDRVTACPPV